MSCAVMYQPYSASPYQPQPTQTQSQHTQEALFVRGASPADPSTAAAAAAGKEQKYKVCGSPSAVTGPQTPPGPSEEEAAGSDQHNVKFLTSNCVLVTNYCGDVAHVVDEHFARALSHNAGFETKHGAVSGKDNVPMTQRNLPASFWNSGYHSRSTVTSIGHGGGHDLYSDPYHSSALHGLHQSDPWHYALATQAAGYPTRELSGYGGGTAGVAAAAARFNGYSPLLFPSSSRLPAAQPTKSEWGGRGYPDVPPELTTHPHPHPHAHPHSHPLDPGFGAGAVGYGNVVTGLESSLHAAAGGKDSYWL